MRGNKVLLLAGAGVVFLFLPGLAWVTVLLINATMERHPLAPRWTYWAEFLVVPSLILLLGAVALWHLLRELRNRS